MKGQFYLHFETMPEGTGQQKGVRVVNGRPYFYKKPSIETAEYKFKAALLPYKPKKPSTLPIKLSIWFYFDVKNKKLWGQPKPTRADVDNYLKVFLDCMTAVGFWKDDAQVVDVHVGKFYAEKASIAVSWAEVFTNDG